MRVARQVAKGRILLGIFPKLASTPEIIEHFSQSDGLLARRAETFVSAPPFPAETPFRGFAKNVFPSEEVDKAEAVKSVYWKRRRIRYALSRLQREALMRYGCQDDFKSLCKCGRDSVPKYVRTAEGEKKATGSPGCPCVDFTGTKEIVTDDNGAIAYSPRFSFSWVRRCGGALSCFNCAPKIRYYRSGQIKEVLSRMWSKGYSYMFWTFTAPHDLDTDPKTQIKSFNAAMKFLKSGRFWQEIKETYGLEYSITATELTDDAPWVPDFEKSGSHFHKHIVVFYKIENRDKASMVSEDEATRLAFDISVKWVDALCRYGLCPEDKWDKALAHAFKLDLPKFVKKNGELCANQDELGSYCLKGAAVEMTPSIFLKKGKTNRRIGHFQLYYIALAERSKYPYLEVRMIKIMYALKGLHWIHFSKGLLEICNMVDVSDSDIMKEKLNTTVCEVPNENYLPIDEYKSQGIFLEALHKWNKTESVFVRDDDGNLVLDDNEKAIVDDAALDCISEDVDSLLDLMGRGENPLSGSRLSDPPDESDLVFDDSRHRRK